MKVFKKILIGIDFGESSRRALRQAVRIAAGDGTKPTALHVVTPSEIEDYQQYYTIPTDTMLKAFRTGIEDVVEEELGSRDAVECRVTIGVPYHELMREVRDSNCDLLVLGSRGDNADAHEVGYFAAKCVRHAEVPVLLNRRLHNEPFKRVVACIDYSAVTNEVIETAARIALDEQSELHIVHATCPPWMRPTHVLYNLETAENDDFRKEYRELLDEQMEAKVHMASQLLPAKVEGHNLEHSNPGQALINFLDGNEADLAIVGRIGGTGTVIKEFLMGSVAERLIHRSPCSVITVPCRSQ